MGTPVNGHLAKLLDLARTGSIDQGCHRQRRASGEKRNEWFVILFQPPAN
jgi:hypothetical protein